MSSSDYKVRRATLEDIGQLQLLWHTVHLPVEDLGRRITEFQVAENAEGKIIGTVGMQIASKQGWIHSEAFADFSTADQLRPMLWERLQSVANNYGLLRLWTREEAPFWNRCGLGKADAEALEKMPPAWRISSAGWLTLKLKDSLEEMVSVDDQFAMFVASEKQRTQQALQSARILKFIATLIALGLAGAVGMGAFYLLKNHPELLRR